MNRQRRARLPPLLGLLLMMAMIGKPLPAMADQLFPPINAQNGHGDCPPNQGLVWDGKSVRCEGITVRSCPAGQGLVGINNGEPVCAVPDRSNPATPPVSQSR
jgi:hypothetical protein